VVPADVPPPPIISPKKTVPSPHNQPSPHLCSRHIKEDVHHSPMPHRSPVPFTRSRPFTPVHARSRPFTRRGQLLDRHSSPVLCCFFSTTNSVAVGYLLFGRWVAAHLYQQHIHAHSSGSVEFNATCIGSACFRHTFLIGAMSCLTAVVAAVYLSVRPLSRMSQARFLIEQSASANSHKQTKKQAKGGGRG
jgi:hypothetical protein